jgi:hypothetical protein
MLSESAIDPGWATIPSSTTTARPQLDEGITSTTVPFSIPTEVRLIIYFFNYLLNSRDSNPLIGYSFIFGACLFQFSFLASAIFRLTFNNSNLCRICNFYLPDNGASKRDR